tara:strand:- start:3195 stop:3578 length:384 start_codon:yes stop_codon:yes gene_type:complete
MQTLYYVPFFGILFALLSIMVSAKRCKEKSFGVLTATYSESLQKAIRVHANAAEYIPISILVLFLGELAGAHVLYLHVCYIALFVSRVLVPIGIMSDKHSLKGAGFGINIFILILASIYDLFLAFMA